MIDYEEIEKNVLSILKQEEPTHIWEILKTTHNNGISERLTRKAMNYLVHKKCVSKQLGFYKLTEEGKDYFDKLTAIPDKKENVDEILDATNEELCQTYIE